MKNIFILSFLLSALAMGLQAQEIKIATVDMDRLHRSYYKTREAEQKLEKEFQRAKQQAEQIQTDGKALLTEFRDIEELSENPALTEEARAKAKEDLQAKQIEIQQKQMEFQQFQMNTRRSIEQRQKTMRDLLLDEIKKVAVRVAKEKGANLVLDATGGNLTGVPTILYAEPAWDITEEVGKILNANAPVEEESAAAAALQPADQ